MEEREGQKGREKEREKGVVGHYRSSREEVRVVLKSPGLCRTKTAGEHRFTTNTWVYLFEVI